MSNTITNVPVQEVIRIAVIDDDEDDFFFINDYLKGISGKQFVTEWFNNYDSGLHSLRSRSYHLYFVDYFLGNKTGLDLLKEAANFKLDQPVVLLTGFGSKDIDIQAMECGATDYLIKSEMNTEKLERCIRYALERAAFLEELRKRETRYRSLFEGSKDAVFITDTNLLFTEVNPSAHQLLDSSSGTLLGRSLYDFIEDSVQKYRIRDLVANAGMIDDLEIKICRDDKQVRTCLLSLSVLTTNGQIAVHGILHDISTIKKTELANLQVEKLAANERLIRMLAHEIRNPLNNITLSAEHLVPADDNEEQKDFLNIIRRNSARINQIISELLNLACPGDLIFEKHPLQDIIDESLMQASDRLKLNKIKLEKKYPPSPFYISCDKNKLIIAFTNIFINAIEAMETNEGKLSVYLGESSQYYTVTVQDNGMGIPKEYLSKLFDPFFTLKKNGTGLGLTASYSIMQSHKASMQVESHTGEGTTFTISFPKSD